VRCSWFVAGSTKLQHLLLEDFKSRSATLKQLIGDARKVTLCMDGWTKKSLTVSYIGISACFFDLTSHKAAHAFLNLSTIQHPHTGEKLADCLKQSLQQWGIDEQKVFLVVSDNGANMLKAIRLLQEDADTDDDRDSREAEDSDDVSDAADGQASEDKDTQETTDDELALPHVAFRRMPCLAHTLQLIVKIAYKHYDSLITKTRHLISRMRRSSVAMEKLTERCGKAVINDCTTRWSSTFRMVQRLIEMKTDVNSVLCEIGTFVLHCKQ